MKNVFLSSLLLGTGTVGLAAPVTYDIDPHHTFPSIELDHMGGLSTFRGKFNQSSGKIVLDRENKTGTVDITVDTASIDLGYHKLNDHIKTDAMLDVAKFPTATYHGRFSKFDGETPREVAGELTLHGVTKPLTLTLDHLLCKPHPMTQKEVCGAAASGHFNRDDFGVDYGKAMGFKQEVKLVIQVEASRAD